jgi:hypothetical protein
MRAARRFPGRFRRELKERADFGLVFGDVGDVIEDQEVEFVELGNRERELAAGDLQSP